MILIITAVVVLLVSVGLVIHGTVRHGWSNYYLVTLGLPLATLVFIVISELGA